MRSKKSFSVFLAVLFVCTLGITAVSAAEKICEQNFNNVTSEELKAQGWLIEDSTANVVDNGELFLSWDGSGRMFRYWEDVNDYTISFLWKPGAAGDGDCYKATLSTRLPAKYSHSWDGLVLFEPDNGDGDHTSHLGIAGINFCGYGNTFEVVIHRDDSGRQFGAGALSCKFTLPNGKTFENGLNVKIKDEGETVAFWVDNTQFGSIQLSSPAVSPDLKAPTTFKEIVYRKAVVKDASGNTVLTVNDALVPLTGSFAFVERAATMRVDNLSVVKNDINTDPGTTQTTEGTSGNAATGNISALFGMMALLFFAIAIFRKRQAVN